MPKATNITLEFNEGTPSAEQLKALATFAESIGAPFQVAAENAASTPAEPQKPSYPLWDDRPVKRGTNPAHWILEHHKDLVGTEGARAAIGRRDPELIRHYSVWINPKRHPEDDLGLDVPPRADLSGMSASEILERQRKQVREAQQAARQRTQSRIPAV